jgi:hypothetical protein
MNSEQITFSEEFQEYLHINLTGLRGVKLIQMGRELTLIFDVSSELR